MKMIKYIIYIYKIAKGKNKSKCFDIYFYFMPECFCVHVCLCSICMPGTHRNQERTSDALELK